MDSSNEEIENELLRYTGNGFTVPARTVKLFCMCTDSAEAAEEAA
jgi:hypothetical protein